MSNYILLYSIIQILLNSICSYVDFVNGNNYFYYYINQIASLLIIGLFFKSILKEEKNIFSNIFLFVSVIASLFFSGNINNSFASLPFGILSIFVIINSLYFYKLRFSKIELNYLYSNKNFWHVTGFFVYFSSNFLIFFSYNNLITSTKTLNYAYILWLFHNTIFTLMFIIFSSIELWSIFQKRFN